MRKSKTTTATKHDRKTSSSTALESMNEMMCSCHSSLVNEQAHRSFQVLTFPFLLRTFARQNTDRLLESAHATHTHTIIHRACAAAKVDAESNNTDDEQGRPPVGQEQFDDKAGWGPPSSLSSVWTRSLAETGRCALPH